MNFDCEINESAKRCLDLLDRHAPEESFANKQSSKKDGGVLGAVGLSLERVRELLGTRPMRKFLPRRGAQTRNTARRYLPLVRHRLERAGDWSLVQMMAVAEGYGLSGGAAAQYFAAQFGCINPTGQQCVAFIAEVRSWNRVDSEEGGL